MVPDVHPSGFLGRLNHVCQGRDYDSVQMPCWKLELDDKINGQIYGLVPSVLKEHSPLDLVKQTKV